MLGSKLACAVLAFEDSAVGEFDHRIISGQGCCRVSVRCRGCVHVAPYDVFRGGHRSILSDPESGSCSPCETRNQTDTEGGKMRKLIVSNNVTLDGRVDDVLDWSIPGDDEDFVKRNIDLLSHSDGLILGRKSYEFFAAVWPSRSGEFPDLMNGIPKYVASTTLEDPEWQNAQVIEGDVVEAVRELKAQSGKGLIVYASGELTKALIEHDLIDEYRLWVHPVVLGRGSRFFADGAERMDLELVDATAIRSGVAILTYRPRRTS